jgi:hypothetical protein
MMLNDAIDGGGFVEIADMCARPCLRAAISASASSGQTPEIIDAHS